MYIFSAAGIDWRSIGTLGVAADAKESELVDSLEIAFDGLVRKGWGFCAA